MTATPWRSATIAVARSPRKPRNWAGNGTTRHIGPARPALWNTPRPVTATTPTNTPAIAERTYSSHLAWHIPPLRRYALFSPTRPSSARTAWTAFRLFAARRKGFLPARGCPPAPGLEGSATRPDVVSGQGTGRTGRVRTMSGPAADVW